MLFRSKILKINNSVNSNIAEKLMAHKKGLDGTYLNPTREECFAEFIKAIPELTINKQARLEAENKAKEAKITELEALNQKNQMYADKIERQERMMRAMAKKLDMDIE